MTPAPAHLTERLAELASASSALVSGAQQVAAQAAAALSVGDTRGLVDADTDLELTLEVADARLRAAVELVEDNGDDAGPAAHALLDLIEISRAAVSDISHKLRGLLVTHTGALERFTVSATLENLLWEHSAADAVDPFIRGRALGGDGPMAAPVSDRAEQLVQITASDITGSLRLPGDDPDAEALITFDEDGSLLLVFELDCDTAARAGKWARWILTDLIAACMIPLELDELTVTPAAATGA